ncbi:efflux RND transporter permease subunit [Pseudoalteromonas sp. S16_S37]|nr:efflux RND transporter permease subunit [Pseudoalteromonas sp. S16_S37]
MSYFDALFLLPAHLNDKNLNNSESTSQRVNATGNLAGQAFEYFRDQYYLTSLQLCLKHKYTTHICALGSLMLTFSWVQSGRIDFGWYPQVPSEKVSARLEMPVNASFEQTLHVARRIEQAGIDAIEELGTLDDIQSRELVAGMQSAISATSATSATVTTTLKDESTRSFSQRQFANLWRAKASDIPQAKSLQFDYLIGFGRANGIYLEMHHDNAELLAKAASQLASTLASFEVIFDVSDGLTQGKPLMEFTLSEDAKSLGLTESSLGEQLRAAFFGAEALRFLRNDEVVKVWVRLPVSQKNSLSVLNNFIIKASNGAKLPISQAAIFNHAQSTPQIKRENGKKISLSAVM